MKRLKNDLVGYFLIVVIIFFIPLFSHAQFNNDFKKKYQLANDYIDDNDYSSALPVFFQLDSMVKNNSNINFYIGVCYINSSDEKAKAIPYLEKAIQNVSLEYTGNYDETMSPVFAYYYLGKAYMIVYRIDEAIEYFYRFRYYLTSKNKEWIKNVDKQVEMCYNSKIIIQDTVKINIDNLGPSINTGYPEYSPVISANEDTLIFTSRRLGSTGEKLEKNKKYYEDIYISFFDKNTKTWSRAKQIGSKINTPKHEASISLTPDGKQLFIYKDDGKDGNIYLSKIINNEWSVPEKLPEPINTKAWETHACLSSDGVTLYFVSNRKGGFGGRDIYKSIKQSDGSWSKPKNLGPKINTSNDEDSPFIVIDTTGAATLYFSSNGHQSIGGFDIFSSKQIDEDTWTNSENLGYPVNTTDNDVFFVPTRNMKYAYYASTKPGGYGDLDIYKIYIGGKEKPKLILKGVVIDSATNERVLATVNIKDLDSNNTIIYYNTDTIDTEFHLLMPTRKNIEITINAENYQLYKEIFVMPLSPKNDVRIYKKFLLKKYPLIAHNSNKKTDCYTVQVGAGKINKEILDKIPNIKVINCNDGIKIFVVGEFTNKEDASLLREQMIQRGFIGSWVRECVDTADMAIGERIVLKNIFFDFNKSILRLESTKELQKVIMLLKNNPTFNIEIAGHTDNIGVEEYNIKLSTSRAYAIYDYLIKNSIEKERLSYKGYGFKQPIATNTTYEGQQKNRRCEFRIINK